MRGRQLRLAREPAQRRGARAAGACGWRGRASPPSLGARPYAKRRRARRASAANASVSASRCSSGPAERRRRRSPRRARCSAGLNGNSAETPSITVVTASRRPRRTGTSARNAIGSDSANASSEAARTSRASAPIATPMRREAEPARQQRRQPRGRARPVEPGRTPPGRTASAGRPRARTARPAATFSDSSAGARDEPAHEPAERVLLALQRQQAGGQQQRDEHQRDRHRDRDGERARARSVAPLTLVCSTSTGEPIVARIGLETSRLSAASRAKRATCVSATRSGASFGQRSRPPPR